MRYFFQVSYNGLRYHGWQAQINAITVQEVLEKVLQKILGEKINITGSSRTDSRVHCIKQFFHLDFDSEWNFHAMMHTLNSMLPGDITIHAIRKVKPTAHARYDAIRRIYEYRIMRTKNSFLQGYAYPFFREIDIHIMNEAAALLIGKNDFQAFSKVKTDVNHFICDLMQAKWGQTEDVLMFTVVANRFLRGMVRAIVGSLLDVGTGKVTIKNFQAILKSKDRRQAGMNVSPEGLYLVNVIYPDHIFL